MKKLETVLCAITTPFQKDEEVDFEGLKTNLDFLVEKGIGGVVICGGTGEFVGLKTDERKQVAEVALKHIDSRITTVVGVAAETTRETVELAKHAESNGADGIMVINPFYHKPTDEEIYYHFEQVAKNVNIPIIVYNNPGASGTDMSADLVVKLMSIKNVDYVKEATGDITRIREIKNRISNEKSTLCGGDEIICETLENKATGWVSISANVCPTLCQKIFDLGMSGNFEESRKIFNSVSPLFALCEGHSKGIQIAKYALELQGAVGGESRMPKLPLTVEEKAMVKKLMKESGII